jgi:hypothetical protein
MAGNDRRFCPASGSLLCDPSTRLRTPASDRAVMNPATGLTQRFGHTSRARIAEGGPNDLCFVGCDRFGRIHNLCLHVCDGARRYRWPSWHRASSIAAVAGRLPQGIGVARLFDAPVAWARQPQTGARAGGSLIREFPGAKSRLGLARHARPTHRHSLVRSSLCSGNSTGKGGAVGRFSTSPDRRPAILAGRPGVVDLDGIRARSEAKVAPGNGPVS